MGKKFYMLEIIKFSVNIFAENPIEIKKKSQNLIFAGNPIKKWKNAEISKKKKYPKFWKKCRIF